MRDLKHLIYFENLLQQANNDLVQDACKDGRLALAWNCSYIPEVLLDTDNCFGVRLRAPNCTNPDMATYYMTNRSCPYSKSILERAFEGGYNFISALIGQECCTTMNRMEQYFEYCELIPNDKFFCTYLDMPLRKTEWHAGYYRRQIEQKIIQPLEKVYGVDFSEEKLRKRSCRRLCGEISHAGSVRPDSQSVRRESCNLSALSYPTVIIGEPGSGREEIAYCIHGGSDRAQAPCLTIDLATFSEMDAPRVLFGYDKGDSRGFTLMEGAYCHE